jgi:hypothetical protein
LEKVQQETGQWLDKCSEKKAWHGSTNSDRKQWDMWRTKSIACASFSLSSRGLFTMNLSWQARQSILPTNMNFTATAWTFLCFPFPKYTKLISRHCFLSRSTRCFFQICYWRLSDEFNSLFCQSSINSTGNSGWVYQISELWPIV